MMNLTCNMPKHIRLWSAIDSFAPAYLPTSILGTSNEQDTKGLEG